MNFSPAVLAPPLILALLVTLGSPRPASAVAPHGLHAAAPAAFGDAVGAEAVIRWSPIDDVPTSIRNAPGGRRLPSWEAGHANAVMRLFTDNADLFRLRDGVDAFSIAGEREKGSVHHLRAVQTYRGLRVRGGQYMVSVGADGQLSMIAGRSIPHVESEVHATLTPGQAIDEVTALLARAPDMDSITTELVIEPGEPADRLVYEVRLQARTEPFAREVLVDARNGAIAGIRDLGFGATGCAAIWDPNPDHPLHEEDFEISEPVEGVARLEGPQVRVLHQDAAEPAVNTVLPQGCFDFRFDPVTQLEAFDQANVYRCIDHFLREFHGANGFDGMPQPITVILHPFICGEANTGETIGNTIWLTSAGCGYKSSTRDADIIDHEAQHALNNAIGLEGGTDRDREIYGTAIHEALANYFSCAAHDDPVYAEYFFGPQGFANCNSSPDEYNYSRRYELATGTLQNYRLGMIWSGALWDIRNRIGPVIDRIALESLYYLPGTPSMHNAADAVLQADRDHHGGAHQAEMIAALAARGLGPGVPQVTIAGPTRVQLGDSTTWTADVCCGTSPYTYQWFQIPDGSEFPEPIGTDASVTMSMGRGNQLRVRVVDAAGHAVLATLSVQVVLDGTLSVVIEGPQQVLPGVPNRWTARVSGQGPMPLSYQWTLGAGGLQVGGDSMSVTISLQTSTTLKVAVSSPWFGLIAGFLPVAVDRPPIASIRSVPRELAPGATVVLTGQASGGIQPYAWRWTRNGTGPGDVIGTGQSIQITGDSVETDIYLSVTTALGGLSNLCKATISPLGIPMVVAVEGPDRLPLGSAGTWKAVFPGGCPPTVYYQWELRCAEVGCLQKWIGTGEPSITLDLTSDVVLDLVAFSGTRWATSQRRLSVERVLAQSAPVPGQALKPDRPALRMDHAIVRPGGDLLFELEGPPGALASLRLIDAAGRLVAPLFDGRLADKKESIAWRATNLPSGVYLARARIAGETFVRRMIVVR